MDSKLNRKTTDDPHDFVVVAPDSVGVAPSDEEISDLLRAAARQRVDSKGGDAPEADASVPSVDTTFRATDVNNDLLPGRRSFGQRAMRTIAALLLAGCVGAAAVALQASGFAFKKVALKWLPKFALTTTLPLEQLGLATHSTPAAAPPTDEPAVAETDTPQTASPAQPAPESAGAKPADSSPASEDSAQLIQSMAHDLAGVGQEVEALKASIAELKASQQQMARDLAKATEQNSRAKLSSIQPHVPAGPARKPAPAYVPSPTPAASAYRPAPAYPAPQAAAPPMVQPYAPRPVETLPPPPNDPGLTVPRPPMPVQ